MQAKMMLPVFIFIACTWIYSVSTEMVDFIKQPKTNEECYLKGDNGTLTLSFNVTGVMPLHNYIVALTVNPDGTGGFKSTGTKLNFYDTSDRDIQHARFQVKMSYVGRTVEYRLDITALEYLDETSPLYAFVIESQSGKFTTNVSSGRATFHVDIVCPQRPQPNNPSTVTTARSHDITSKGNILVSSNRSTVPNMHLLLIQVQICMQVIFQMIFM